MGILKFLYSNNIRNVRMFNLAIHTMWLLLLSLHGFNVVLINIPNTVKFITNTSLFYLCGLVVTLSISSLLSKGRKRILLKYVSLLIGAMVQLLISLKFVTSYPPFDVMVIFSFLLTIWFIGGALYVRSANNQEVTNGYSSTI